MPSPPLAAEAQQAAKAARVALVCGARAKAGGYDAFRQALVAELPIVFAAVADPIGLGVVTNLARPGGNVTGLSTLVPGGSRAKCSSC